MCLLQYSLLLLTHGKVSTANRHSHIATSPILLTIVCITVVGIVHIDRGGLIARATEASSDGQDYADHSARGDAMPAEEEVSQSC
jgi:hypothetical protein